MSNLSDVLHAEKVLIKNKCKVRFSQCTGNYPSEIEDANIRVIKTFQKKLNVLLDIQIIQ